MKRKWVPVLEGDAWVIAPKPRLDHKLPLIAEEYAQLNDFQRNQPNDHCFFRSADGMWQLWACVRRTPVGRLLVNWEAAALTDSPWRLTGHVVRCDREAGESRVDWKGEEFLQSPYVVQQAGTYYFFFGGYDTGTDASGRHTTDYSLAEKQICLMTSADGRTWSRHRNSQGLSRVFAGPGAVRDQCVVRFGSTWYMYYAGHHDQKRGVTAIYARTSGDLLHWSAWRLAQFDTAKGEHGYVPESPLVVERDGCYYLFRTHGPQGGTYVYRSEDPLDFGTGRLEGLHVAHMPDVIAPERIVDGDAEYLSNIRVPDERGGYAISLRRLKWEPA